MLRPISIWDGNQAHDRRAAVGEDDVVTASGELDVAAELRLGLTYPDPPLHDHILANVVTSSTRAGVSTPSSATFSQRFAARSRKPPVAVRVIGVVAVQRTDSALRPNVYPFGYREARHFHSLVLDGVYVHENGDPRRSARVSRARCAHASRHHRGRGAYGGARREDPPSARAEPRPRARRRHATEARPRRAWPGRLLRPLEVPEGGRRRSAGPLRGWRPRRPRRPRRSWEADMGASSSGPRRSSPSRSVPPGNRRRCCRCFRRGRSPVLRRPGARRTTPGWRNECSPWSTPEQGLCPGRIR